MNLWPSLAKKKALRLASFTSTTIGAIFEILEKNLYSAILRIASPGERINAGMVYETIWTWFIKDFENEKAGITEAIQKGEYARKLMNPKSGKDISYHDALTLSPSLVCQEGLEEAIEYCELDGKAKMRMVEDFKAIGLTVRKGYIAKDVTALLIDHIQDIIRRKKRPFARILSKIAMITGTRPMTAYGLS
jgi:hypothetical protein